MKKILVPCDFSRLAIDAFRFTLAIAEKSSGEIHLLNVVELPVRHDTMLMPVLSFEADMLKELQKKTIDRITRITEKYSHKNVKVKVKVIFGATSLMIQDYVKRQKIDLVVMGTHGASGLREFVIGSNTEKIVRNVNVPVIALKKFPKLGSIKDIVFATDLSENDNLKNIVSKVKDLQLFFRAGLHIVKVNTPASFSQDVITDQKLKDFVAKYALRNYSINIFNDLNEEVGIINFAHKIKAGMIAMGTHGRKGLVHALSGSLTEDIVNHVDIPIWTYPLSKKR
jgi:nucleotide-binding universal stress UspA family protein